MFWCKTAADLKQNIGLFGQKAFFSFLWCKTAVYLKQNIGPFVRKTFAFRFFLTFWFTADLKFDSNWNEFTDEKRRAGLQFDRTRKEDSFKLNRNLISQEPKTQEEATQSRITGKQH